MLKSSYVERKLYLAPTVQQSKFLDEAIGLYDNAVKWAEKYCKRDILARLKKNDELIPELLRVSKSEDYDFALKLSGACLQRAFREGVVLSCGPIKLKKLQKSLFSRLPIPHYCAPSNGENSGIVNGYLNILGFTHGIKVIGADNNALYSRSVMIFKEGAKYYVIVKEIFLSDTNAPFSSASQLLTIDASKIRETKEPLKIVLELFATPDGKISFQAR